MQEEMFAALVEAKALLPLLPLASDWEPAGVGEGRGRAACVPGAAHGTWHRSTLTIGPSVLVNFVCTRCGPKESFSILSVKELPWWNCINSNLLSAGHKSFEILKLVELCLR